jgi:hypothetical protein
MLFLNLFGGVKKVAGWLFPIKIFAKPWLLTLLCWVILYGALPPGCQVSHGPLPSRIDSIQTTLIFHNVLCWLRTGPFPAQCESGTIGSLTHFHTAHTPEAASLHEESLTIMSFKKMSGAVAVFALTPQLSVDALYVYPRGGRSTSTSKPPYGRCVHCKGLGVRWNCQIPRPL